MSDLNIRDIIFFTSTVPITDCISHRHKSDDPTEVPRDSGQCGWGYVYWGRREGGWNWKAIQL